MRKLKFVSVFMLLALLVSASTKTVAATETLVQPRSGPSDPSSMSSTALDRRDSITYRDEVYGYTVQVPSQWQVAPTSKEGWGGVAQFTRFSPDFTEPLAPESEADWADIEGLRVAIGVVGQAREPGESLSAFVEAYESDEAADIPPTEWKTVASEVVALQVANGGEREGIKRVRQVMGMTSSTYYLPIGRWVFFVWRTPAESQWDAEFDQLLGSLNLLPEIETNIENEIGRILQESSEDLRTASEESVSVAAWDDDPAGWIVPFAGSHPISQGPGCWDTHQGWLYEAIDYSMASGTGVLATDAGYVLFAGWSNAGWGNLVKLRHGSDGYDSWYAHLSSFGGGISPGQSVWQHQPVGNSGNTGNSTGPHLHFHAKDIGEEDTHWIRTIPYTSWTSGDPYSPCSSGYDGEAWYY